MGTPLTGTQVQSDYGALLKTTDNAAITGTLKTITDGLGNDTALQLSSSAAKIIGTLDATGLITSTLAAGGQSVSWASGNTTGVYQRFSTSAGTKGFVGTADQILGGGSVNDIALASSGGNVVLAAGSVGATLSSIGFAVTGALSATGFVSGKNWFSQTSDVAISAGSGYSDLTGLSVALEAGKRYGFRATVFTNTSGAGTVALRLNASGGLTATSIRSFVTGITATGSTVNGGVATSLGVGSGFSTGLAQSDMVHLTGVIDVNVAGTMTLQGSRLADVTTTTFYKGSFMEVWQQN